MKIKKIFRYIYFLILSLMITVGVLGCSAEEIGSELSGGTNTDIREEQDLIDSEDDSIREDGVYTSKEDLHEYIKRYKRLPQNFITKSEAKELGWDAQEGNLDEIAKGKSIGGDHFGNFEKKLPEKKGRKYKEADVDYRGGHRNAKRIVYSNDGYIYYTEDHYNTFEELERGKN